MRAVAAVLHGQGFHVLALRLVYCLGPIFFYGLALKLIWSYPLTPARHARLRERLERRAVRLAATDSMTRTP